MNRMQHTRPCASCGKMMYNVGNRRKYCTPVVTEPPQRQQPQVAGVWHQDRAEAPGAVEGDRRRPP